MPSDTPPVHPVILSGGSGTRLWPLSRAEYPKQMLALTGKHSMLQATALRAADLPGARTAVVVTGDGHNMLVQEQLMQVGCPPACILLEPAGRNTAPAIALAALHLTLTDPDALMLVLPSDHIIEDQRAFGAAVARGLIAARDGRLCTFGIPPAGPETGYGYIQAGHAIAEIAGVRQVTRFIEKPDMQTARSLLEVKDCFWNSGMFAFTARTFLQELATHQPEVLAAVRRAWDERSEGIGLLRPHAAAFSACPAISIDYAVMQTTRRAAMVEARFAWSDVGSWDSLWQTLPKNADNNCVAGDVVMAGTQNSLVHAAHRLVSVVGMDNVAVIETADAVLVINKNRAQDVREVVAQLQGAGRQELLRQVRVQRSWGWYEVTDRGERFQVKRLMVEPGKRLSMQMHHQRAEHWVVVSGQALITINGVQSVLKENQSAFVPLGQKHRLENPGTDELHMIEVQSGTYLGEDDIVRFDA
jgi:mannose-1-phosphate guanylyltransferase/mannose-6-phosphate isomerase